jgi:hypothetical protein
MVPNLRPPQHEQTPADRFRAVTVCPRPSPAPIVHKTLALGRVQSEPLLALDRQKPARFVRHTYARWKVLRVDAYCGRRPGGQYLKPAFSLPRVQKFVFKICSLGNLRASTKPATAIGGNTVKAKSR